MGSWDPSRAEKYSHPKEHGGKLEKVRAELVEIHHHRVRGQIRPHPGPKALGIANLNQVSRRMGQTQVMKKDEKGFGGEKKKKKKKSCLSCRVRASQKGRSTLVPAEI